MSQLMVGRCFATHACGVPSAGQGIGQRQAGAVKPVWGPGHVRRQWPARCSLVARASRQSRDVSGLSAEDVLRQIAREAGFTVVKTSVDEDEEDFEDGDGCGGDAGDAFGRGDDAKPSPYSTPIPSIDPLQLILKEIVPRAEEREGAAEASSRPRLVLLDVRPYEAYREGRVPASISMPLAGVSRDAVENELGPPSSRDMPQVVVVGTGTRGSNIRTVMDAQQMWVRLTRVYGYPEDSVQVLDGGYEAWAKLQKDFMR